MSNTEIELSDKDYTLSDGRAWFRVKNFSIRIYAVDEGVVVDVYGLNREDEDAVASTYAFDNEVNE